MRERTLGLFPLPLVLFPGAPQLLHVFEPRYRQLLDDCLADDHRFGLSFIDPQRALHGAPRLGDVGCQAHVQQVRRLADGRSHVLCVGEERFAIKQYVSTDRLYRVAHVEFLADEPTPHDERLVALARDVRHAFKQAAVGVRAVQGVWGGPVEVPAEPAALSFHVASALVLDPVQKQELLESRSPFDRLRRCSVHLEQFKADLTRRINAGLATRRNGSPARPGTGGS